MDLTELLAFAVKNKVLELHIAPGMPPLLKLAGDPELRRVNVPALESKDIEKLPDPLLDAQAKEAMRFKVKCEIDHEVPRLGRFRLQVAPELTVIAILPPPGSPPGEKKPGFFKKLFGG